VLPKVANAKRFEIFLKMFKFCCMIEGFADLGGLTQVAEWFIKNIQPISVGI
jgi:hypothetical protein